MAKDSADLTPAPEPRPRKRYWQLPVFVLGVTAAIMAVRGFPPQPAQPHKTFQRDVLALKAALEKRPVDLSAVETTMKPVADQADIYPEDAPRINYLLGSASVLLAEQGPPELAPERWTMANASFSKCDVLKLTEKHEQERCVYRSAKAAAAIGAGDAKLLIPALTVIPHGEEAGERGRLLAESYLRIVPPDTKRARDELAAYLSGVNRASPAALARHKLKLGELCLTLNEPDRARAWLKEVGANAPVEVQALAKLRLGRLAGSENNWNEAVKLFEAAQAMPGLPVDQLGMIQYETGRGWIALNNTSAAQAYFEQAEKSGGQVAVAARVRLAEMAVRDPAMKGNRNRAADWILNVVQSIPSANDFRNVYVSLNEVNSVVEEIMQVSINETDFASAVRIASGYGKIAPPGRDVERRAEANAAWAELLEKTPETMAQARTKRLQSAEDFQTLAKNAANPAAQVDHYRRAAVCLRKAGDDKTALQVIEQILMVPGAPADSTAEAFMEKGEILLASHKYPAAVEALSQASTGSGVTATLARVKLARSQIEEGKRRLAANAGRDPKVTEEARAMIELGQKLLTLIANKTYETLGEREAQQEALFELGKVLVHQNRNYVEAEARFRQLIQSNPSGTYAEDAKLYLGTCLLLTARSENDRASPDADRKLVEAHGLFLSLTDSKRPTIQTQADLRVVRSLYLLRRFDDLPDLCAKLTQKYHGRVEELIVLSMLYWGYKQADRPKQADQTLVKMQEVYSALPDSAFTGLLDEYTRNYWEKGHVPPLTRTR